MSTKASLIYDNEKGLHIYQELLDNTVHVEVERAGMFVDVEIMSFPEWVSLGLPKQSVDMAERRRTQDAADLGVRGCDHHYVPRPPLWHEYCDLCNTPKPLI